MAKIKVDKKALPILVFSLSLLGVLILVSKMQFDKVSALKNQVAAQKAQLVNTKNMVAKIPSLEEQIAKAGEIIKTFEAMLPSEQEVPALFKDLDNIASSTGVKFEWIGPESWTEGEHYIRFFRKIKIRGGYHQIGLFINKLENAQRFIRIDDVEIKSIPENPYIHEASMIVSTFVAKEGM